MRLAIVDDDEDLIDFVREALGGTGYKCVGFRDATGLLAALRRETFDLLLLDWGLPDTSGFDLLQRIRASDTRPSGIIMITNRADKESIAEALRAGADDYIIKPESAAVIVARIEAVLRRATTQHDTDRFLRFGGYEFDRLTQTTRIGDEPVALSSKEFALALLFFDNIHRPMSRGYILETLWHSASDLPTRTLDMHVSKLRTKLRLRPESGYRIIAISGYGYRMEQFPTENAP